MRAPERLVRWLRESVFVDRKNLLQEGLRLQYHSRSDAHSKHLAACIVDDLVDVCDLFRQQAAEGKIAFAINHTHSWPNGKTKTIDLAVGIPAVPMKAPPNARINQMRPRRSATDPDDSRFSRLLVACELKSVMTEHGKSQPRIYSELNDAHTIVHQGDPTAVAAGMTVINIAPTFVSPLRQRRGQPLFVTRHDQPRVTANMVRHLRGLPLRTNSSGVGLDAYCTFVIHLDNQGTVLSHNGDPAPQPGVDDHYETFLAKICRGFTNGFTGPKLIRERQAPFMGDRLGILEAKYPGLLEDAAKLLAKAGRPGAEEFGAIVQANEGSTFPEPRS